MTPAHYGVCVVLGLLSMALLSPGLAHGDADSSAALVIVGWREPAPQPGDRIALRGARIVDEILQDRGESTLAVSSPPRPEEPASTQLASELHQCINDAIRAIAAGDLERGSREITRCQQMIARVRPALLGQDETAAEVLDACLVGARLIMESESNEDALADALAQTHSCRAEVPMTAPTGRRHSRPVLDMLERVDSTIERQGGILVVRHPARARCDVRINHRAVGYAPVFLRLGPGTYEVSAECPDEAIRPKRVQVRSGTESEVTLQPAQVLAAHQLPPTPGLRVVDGRLAIVLDQESPEHFRELARRTADALGVERLVTVWAEQAEGRWQYHLGSRDRQGGESTSMPWVQEDRHQRARFADVLFPARPSLAEGPPLEGAAPTFDPLLHIAGGGALTVAGIALAAAGAGLSELKTCRSYLPNDACSVSSPDWPLVMGLALPGVAAALSGAGWMLGAVAEDATAWWVATGVTATGALASFLAIAIAAGEADQCLVGTENNCALFRALSTEGLATWATVGSLFGVASITYAIVAATDEGHGPRLQLSVGPMSAHLGGSF